MNKFLSRKFLQSFLVTVAGLLNLFFGVDIPDTVIDQVVSGLMALIPAVTYIISEAIVDKARASQQFVPVPVPVDEFEEPQGEEEEEVQ